MHKEILIKRALRPGALPGEGRSKFALHSLRTPSLGFRSQYFITGKSKKVRIHRRSQMNLPGASPGVSWARRSGSSSRSSLAEELPLRSPESLVGVLLDV